MNDTLLKKINSYNDTINEYIALFDLKFDKDVLMVSLVQFHLNKISYFKDIYKEDVEYINYYLNFDIQFDEISKISGYIKEHKNEIPFIFELLKIEKAFGLNELNSYIGLKKVKDEIDNLVKLIEVRKKREIAGLKNPIMTYHLCFLGNPGTGKTTVARIVGKLYKSLGILTKGQIIEVGRQDLVAGYVGQTAIKTKEVINKSKGGILFIDEAYSLTNKSENDFGFEAIEVLLKEMEDNRDDFVVIVAGYDDLMNDFLESNPGLNSRFNTFIHFEDYDTKELVDIIEMQCNKNDYVISVSTKEKLASILDKVVKKKDDNFSNARYARNLFENAVKKQSIRVAELEDVNEEELKKLEIEDFIEKEEK